MRCKVVCSMKQTQENGTSYYLSFSAVYSGSEENKEFFKYTPGGTIQFNVVQLKTAAKFEVGKEYYIDFTPAS